jgi:hypothetical protein
MVPIRPAAEDAKVMTRRDWILLGVMIVVMVGAAVFLIVIAANGLMLPPSGP